MSLPKDYAERVYAGVLGKLIGVYVGRPFEGWTYERILKELGEIDGYVHDRLPWGKEPPLVVTDDDVTGTFTFLRALPDYGNSLELTPAQIGQTWLNYIIEERTILWWGGFGNSTEHTAYLRLKSGAHEEDGAGLRIVDGKEERTVDDKTWWCTRGPNDGGHSCCHRPLLVHCDHGLVLHVGNPELPATDQTVKVGARCECSLYAQFLQDFVQFGFVFHLEARESDVNLAQPKTI